jgi:PIN domain nuclease of toxin-antitoxin system
MDRDRLSNKARNMISDTSVTKHVSVVSFYEMAIKISISKLKLSGLVLDGLPVLLYDKGVELIV